MSATSSPASETTASETTTKEAPAEVSPVGEEQETDQTDRRPDLPWRVIVWNDPINLMTYVTWVLQKLFGYSKAKATKLMMDVHTKGKATVASGTRERAEIDCHRLHQYGLWATIEQD